MRHSGLILRALRTLPAIVATGLLSAGMALATESTASAPLKKPAVTEKPAAVKSDHKTRELPPDALGMDTYNSHGYEPGDKPEKRPDEFKFGNNTLHVDASKNDPTPPVGFEANGQSGRFCWRRRAACCCRT